MRSLVLAMAFLAGMAHAFAGTSEELEGRYTNSAYNGEYSYQNAWVEIHKGAQGTLELVFNVPCGTKLIPRVFKINATSPIDGDLELIEQGASQCYTGNNPHIILTGNTLNIETSPDVRTPGFNGTYELSK